RVVGIWHEPYSGAAGYVADDAIARVLGRAGTTRGLRVASTGHDDAARAATLAAVERAAEASGTSVGSSLDLGELRTALAGPTRVLIVALVTLAVLMAPVGGLGLAATLSTNVAERTREFGVVRAIGGSPATVVRMVVTEGLFAGALSWVVAVVA